MFTERHQRSAKVLGKDNVMISLDVGEIDSPMAHQVVDHLAAQSIIVIQPITALHRQQARV